MSNVIDFITHPARRASALRYLVNQRARWHNLPPDMRRLIANEAVENLRAGRGSAAHLLCVAETQIRLAARTRPQVRPAQSDAYVSALVCAQNAITASQWVGAAGKE